MQKSHGGVFNTITQNTFNEIEVNLPTLPEQKDIAEVLSSLDDKIDLLHRQNKTLEDMAQALFRRWFIDNPEREGWKDGKLGDVIKIFDTSDGCPVLQYASCKFWANNHTHILKSNKPYENWFIWHFLLNFNIENYITGAVQPKINQANLKSIKFPKYPHELTNKFQSIIRPSFKKIIFNQSQISTLENLRDTLLSKLMSGKVRVKY